MLGKTKTKQTCSPKLMILNKKPNFDCMKVNKVSKWRYLIIYKCCKKDWLFGLMACKENIMWLVGIISENIVTYFYQFFMFWCKSIARHKMLQLVSSFLIPTHKTYHLHFTFETISTTINMFLMNQLEPTITLELFAWFTDYTQLNLTIY